MQIVKRRGGTQLQILMIFPSGKPHSYFLMKFLPFLAFLPVEILDEFPHMLIFFYLINFDSREQAEFALQKLLGTIKFMHSFTLFLLFDKFSFLLLLYFFPFDASKDVTLELILIGKRDLLFEVFERQFLVAYILIDYRDVVF